jgi:FKBP-type peptidyl-prolyl cis-trans isomerase FkpA
MNNRSLIAILAMHLILVGGGAYAADDELKSDEEKMFYFLGSNYGNTLRQLNLSDDEIELVIRGMRDAVAGDVIEMDAASIAQKLQAFGEERMKAVADEEKAASQAYLEKMAAEDGAITTESGIVIRELVAGTGNTPAANSVVKAHYHGTLRNGVVFDSSVDRGEPFQASLGQVIPCWREAMTLMKEGGKAVVTCPPDQAYGDRGAGQIPGGAALTFEVELISIVE